ncbi:hypothetical protein Tcan_18882 [Toxocara canis]|uniref:Uncharacterized protein n=1 Tax=Toxocara canis TaxID=6265 RepID=A0A0B2VH27_TOXCA|nr:hypothetical protein Tcan_18882 [Toxocara canis]
MNRYENCLRRCDYSKAKSIRLMGNRHWTVLCEAVKTPNFTDYVQCQQNHQEKVRSRCGLLQLPVSISLKSFCRKLLKYRTCYLQVPSNCSSAAYKFWKAVDDMLSETHHQLLNVYAAPRRIPQQCRWKLSHFGKKHKTPSLVPTTSTITTTTITLRTTTLRRTTFVDDLDDLIEAVDELPTTFPPITLPVMPTTKSTVSSEFSLMNSVRNFVASLMSSNACDAQNMSTMTMILLLCFIIRFI